MCVCLCVSDRDKEERRSVGRGEAHNLQFPYENVTYLLTLAPVTVGSLEFTFVFAL